MEKSGGIRTVESPYVVGIDLGTSNSAIAVFADREPKVIPIEGDKTCPSVVGFREDGSVVVGRQARARVLIDPENTVVSVKRLLGTDWKKGFIGQGETEYTPTDISAKILEKPINGSIQNEVCDLRGMPKRVVITIPANFDDAKRQATLDAANMIGLNVLYLLEEPTAAAVAYGFEKGRDQTIMVYDLGGGTFDISILDVATEQGTGGNFKVLAKEGIPLLGGDDFDRKLMELAAEAFKTSSNVDVLDLTKDQGIKASALRAAQQKLKDACETAKIELTEAREAHVTIPNLVKDENGMTHDLDMTVTREQFEEAIRPLVEQSKTAVDAALQAAKMTIEDISRIVLVGGSTKVPLVRQMLKAMFNGKEPYADMDPDTAVARGAAIMGARYTVPTTFDIEDTIPEVTVNEITTHNLGIEVAQGKFSCLIQKNIEIPKEENLVVSREYGTQFDGQTELQINVYQAPGDVTYVSDENSTFIGELMVTIPAKPRGQERAKVDFEINQQNLLKITVTTSTGTKELQISR